MFKRVQKANAVHEKRIKKGEIDEDEGPRELLMNMDSDSSSSDDSSSENDSDSEDESDGESSSAESNNKTPSEQVKKRKHVEEDEESDDDESSEEEEEEDSDEEDSSEEEEAKELKPPSIEKGMNDPIHIKPNAIVRQGFEHRSCWLCPGVLIKTETMITTHLKSGGHLRKVKRFTNSIEKLKSEERKDPSEGGLSIIDLSEKVEKQLAKQIEGQKRMKENSMKEKLAKRKRSKAAKKIVREERKAIKREKAEKAALNGDDKKKKKKKVDHVVDKEALPTAKMIENDNGGERSLINTTSKKPKSLAEEIIQRKIDQHKLTEKDPRKLTKKYIKSKVLTKGEKEELRKIKNQQRATRQFEQREAKRARKAEKLANKSTEV